MSSVSDLTDELSFLVVHLQVERRLEEEAARSIHYLHTSTTLPLQKLLHEHLITAHLRTLLAMPGSGLVAMLDHDRIDDLARLYRVFWKVQPLGPKELKKAMKETVKERGEKINAAGTGAQEEPKPSTSAAGASEDVKGKGKGKETAGGSGAAAALQSALRWVQEVLDLKDKFDRILKDAFGGDKAVQTAINEVSRRSGQRGQDCPDESAG